MKPLNEWTTEELHRYIGPPGDTSHEVVAELLRREREAMRERCWQECDDVTQQVAANDADWAENVHTAAFMQGLIQAKSRIRRLP